MSSHLRQAADVQTNIAAILVAQVIGLICMTWL